jgi:hypothetical protein
MAIDGAKITMIYQRNKLQKSKDLFKFANLIQALPPNSL